MELFGGVADTVVSLLVFLQDYAIPFLIAITVLVFVHEMGTLPGRALVRRPGRGVLGRLRPGDLGPDGFPGNPLEAELDPGRGLRQDVRRDAPTGRRPGGRAGFRGRAGLVPHQGAVAPRPRSCSPVPFANFLFAVVLMAGIFATVGELSTPSNITAVVEGSAADRAGFKPGDVIRRIDGAEIDRFEQVARIVRMSAGIPLEIEVEREGRLIALVAIPDAVRPGEGPGASQKMGRLGVSRSGGGVTVVRHDPGEAVAARHRRDVPHHRRDLPGDRTDACRAPGTPAIWAGRFESPRSRAMSGRPGCSAWWPSSPRCRSISGPDQPVPHPAAGWRSSDVLCDRSRDRTAARRTARGNYGYRMGIAMLLGLMVFVTWNDLFAVAGLRLLCGSGNLKQA